jgi:uncharacterized protein YwgA
MRNSEYLDKEQPEDSNIGKIQKDDSGRDYRIINNQKVFQIKEETQHDKDLNLVINRVRSSGMKAIDILYGGYY